MPHTCQLSIVNFRLVVQESSQSNSQKVGSSTGRFEPIEVAKTVGYVQQAYRNVSKESRKMAKHALKEFVK